MHVVLVCSSSVDSVRVPLAARPARLARGLRDLLTADGHDVQLVVLPPLTGEVGALAVPRGVLTGHAKHRVDVVHALDAAAGVTALQARFVTGVPTVVCAQPASASALTPAEHVRWRACLRAADALTVPTAADARAARQLGVWADRVHVVALAAAGELPVTPALASPSGERLVSVLSGAHAWGGTVDVVAAVARLRNVQLVVAGRSSVPQAGRRLAAAASAHGVGDRVSVTGWLSSRAVDELVDRSAVVVAPRRSLTSGGSSLRAMGRGRPVVAFDSPVQAEIVVDGETGLLVPGGARAELAHAIAALVDDPFRQEAMGHAGQDRVLARFGPEPTLRSLGAAYDGTRQRVRMAS